ncbi:MAG: zinc-binding dehydrogenase [Vulcanimicrobiota bacterium]
MKGLYFDGKLSLRDNLPDPALTPGEAVIATTLAGVCKTDMEIVKGYMGFSGVLGHEFVGVVKQCDDPSWVGRRVVGEINCAPATDPRHVSERTVLGIVGRDGAMAEAFRLPVANLLEVPEGVPDEVAVFTEPVAAAFEILEQTAITANDRVLVLGDGRLGNLIAQVLATTGCELVMVGKHAAKRELAESLGLATMALSDFEPAREWDLVVDATGSSAGFALALESVVPRGRVVLKTTVADSLPMNLAPLVIHEITLIGSRCGRFGPALQALAKETVKVRPLISGRYHLERGVEAFHQAGQPGALKVLLEV